MRKKYLTLLALCLVASCSSDTLTRTCPSRVYTGPEGTEGVGVCRAGKPTCDESHNIIAANDITPSPEVCDGLDNNCNGHVDWILTDRGAAECLTAGVCARRSERCIDGAWKCIYPSGYGAEVCDGSDNDCNGFVDDIPETDTTYCYSGPVGTAGVGTCHPGVVACVDGEIQCWAEKTPTSESECNGLDDDCDGLVDESISPASCGQEGDGCYDLVFAFDTSGSMSSSRMAAVTAMQGFAEQFSDDYQFALVVISGDTEHVELYQNFTDHAAFVSALSSLADGGAEEASLDAPVAACASENPLGLAYRDGARRAVIMFTDEPPQSYASPPNTELEIADACVPAATPVYIFSRHVWEFQAVAGATGGQSFWLSASPGSMIQDMNTILSEVTCQAPAQPASGP